MANFSIGEELLNEISEEIRDYIPKLENLSSIYRLRISSCGECTGCLPCTGTI